MEGTASVDVDRQQKSNFLSDFEAYQIYCSVKAHFNSKSFDIRKNFAKVTYNNFEFRNDRATFGKIADLYQTWYRLTTVMGSNLMMNPGMWVGDFLDDEIVREHYFRLRRFNDSVLTETKRQSDAIRAKFGSLSAAIETDGDQIPPLIQEVIAGRNGIYKTIAPEGVIAYNASLGLLGHLNKKMCDDNIIWESVYTRFLKYSAFIVFQPGHVEEIRRVIREAFV